MGTRSGEHTLVSQGVSMCGLFSIFHTGCVLSKGLSIFHTKAGAYSYLLRAKQIDMTIRVSFIWCYCGTESLHRHAHTQEDALVFTDSSGMGNAQWTFVIWVSGWRPPGCFSAASDRSERLPVRHIIPSSDQAQPIHTLGPPGWICVCMCVRVWENKEKVRVFGDGLCSIFISDHQ